jgi:hypothetical protein
MTRNYIHDIKPSSRSQKHREALEREYELRMKKTGKKKVPKSGIDEGYQKSNHRGLWYVAGLAVIILAFALTFVFSVAKVYVTPRQGTVSLSGPLLAQKESKDGLTFQMVVLEDDKSVNIPAGEEKYIEQKAVGKVRFFNTHSASAQKLLIDTRLTSPDGNIYKTKTAVTIPGDKIQNGKVVAGTVDVDVYADSAGDSYNIPTDTTLKILGFKTSDKYNDIYAKSITGIEGGFKGNKPDISDEDLKNNEDKLRADLQVSLVEKAKSQLPDGFIMYDKAVITSFDQPVITMSDDGVNAEITQHGTINAIIFKISELSKALVGNIVDEADKDNVTVSNINDLNIELDKNSAVQDLTLMQDIQINITDSIAVVWNVDKDELSKALVDTKKKDFISNMAKFKNIEKAELTLKPFWKVALPSKASSIKIVNTLDESTN